MGKKYELGLATSLDDFHKLYAAAHGVRVDVGVVTVNKEALLHLLYDQGQLCAAIEDDPLYTITLVDGDPEAKDEALTVFKRYSYIES